VLIQYIKRGGKRKGVVVAIGNGYIGWALCKASDAFTSEQALNIALGRALKSSKLSSKELMDYYEDIPTSMNALVENMLTRSAKYFAE
jgi:hypothetical protein